ncbi:cytochrome P450 monooxygenase pc-2 [Epithele typhae]|uniref:cytochrome P450 monooxygenase pc-2 n=1 Tax=Epithele typhae TaxID=378194 RepID=UPI002007A3B0|nr:cytochrome P450 monooxygenase pc-2 [Epithele typhae]KAH9927180.1 cytochrome P450 monooxygenase pc-2 [Epithele typhae]
MLHPLKLPPGLQLYTALAAVSIPVAYALGIKYSQWRVRRRARRAGAIIPRRWEGKRIGSLDLLQYGMERFQNGYIEREFGHVQELYIMWDSIYLTTDPGITKYSAGPEFRDTMHSVLGTGVFNADGMFHRTMTRPYFSRDRISHFELFNRHGDLAIKKMKDRFAAGRALDFQDLVARFTLDSATEFLFGSCVNSLHADLPYPYNDPDAKLYAREASNVEAFATAFLGAQNVISIRMRVGWMWRFKELFYDAGAEHMRVVDAFIQPILEAAIKKNKEAGNAGEESKDNDNETLLDHLVKFTDDSQHLIAGRDTTATTLSFAVYLLCLYPAIGPTAMPTFDDIRGMKYLRAVINETLRLYPAPFNVRVANRDTTVPNPDPTQPPFFVSKGTSLAYSVFLMHRRRTYGAPMVSLEFDPDRFLDERVNKHFTNNPFIFCRSTPGLGSFAYNEMSFFLIRLLQNFSHMEMDLAAQPPEARPSPEWASAEGQKGREKVVAKSHLTMYIHGGLWVRMTEAERET